MPFMPGAIDLNAGFSDLSNTATSDDEGRIPHVQEPPTKRIHLGDPSPEDPRHADASLSRLPFLDGGQHLTSDETEEISGRNISVSASVSTGDDLGAICGGSGRSTLELRHVYVPGPAYPLSAFEGRTAPQHVSQEQLAIEDLKGCSSQDHSEHSHDFTFFELNHFTIYRPPGGKHGGESVCLDKLLNHRYPRFLVDGELSARGKRHVIKGATFEVLTVDGYLDSENVDSRGNVCIQSLLAARSNVWYSLCLPSTVYKRFFDPFLWLVQFTKHVVNYLFEHDRVVLNHFKAHFHKWLAARYLVSGAKGGAIVASWLSHVPFSDFRTTFNANVAFLYKECFSIDDHTSKLLQHPIWEEVDPQRLRAIPVQQPNELWTIVTPFAFDCFRNMYFGDQLEERAIKAPALRASVAARKKRMGLTAPMFSRIRNERHSSINHGHDHPAPRAQVDLKAGDVVAVDPFGDGWTGSASVEWYAYIQRIRIIEGVDTKKRLDILWLYHPADTTLGKAYYPFENELFLSDNCNCGKDALRPEQVVRKANVNWFAGDPHAETGFFVRRKYRTVAEDDTYDFVDLHRTDFGCKCSQKASIYDEVREDFSVGDTILYKLRSQYLQVGQVVGFTSNRVKLRVFRRMDTINSEARPNELLPTDEQIEVAPGACIRPCHVRYFESDRIPTPYDRNGAGDFFFIKGSSQVQGQGPDLGFPPLRRGWSPTEPQPQRQLKGMGLFCGGGTFDRGLQEGGAIKFRYAIDYAERALHSYKANAPHKVHYFLGSVDDYFAQALAGRADDRIAQPGDFNFLSAGSPCQGFSYLQIDRNSAGSRRNASKIASVISFMDFYSPEYLILENVLALTRNIGPQKDENVFLQLLAALVALGYQVQQFLMDSWLYSSSQSRSRVFIVATAPGLKPLAIPPVSHGHPQTSRYHSVALGTSSSGVRFGVRHDHFTPFAHVSASQAVRDLPNIEDAQVQLCPQFPDHRTSTEEVAVSRHRIAMVPVRPRNMGLMQLRHKQHLSGEPLRWCEKVNRIRKLATSKVYRRVHPDGLFGTIVTKLHPVDGINGTVLHWEQHRVITVMEARRAQGFPDHEVIIGTPTQQLEIIGNSVERNTALVLGLQVRESWMSPSNRIYRDDDAVQRTARPTATRV